MRRRARSNYVNCWNTLKPCRPQHNHETGGKCEGGESRKNSMDGAGLNPKRQGKNGKSAAKPRKGEGSTTISTAKRLEVRRPKPKGKDKI